MVQMDTKVMAAVISPYRMSIVYTFRLSGRTQLKSRSPQTPELASHQGIAYKKLDQDKAKIKGQKESLNYITVILCKIRIQLLFSFSFELKTPQVSYREA